MYNCILYIYLQPGNYIENFYGHFKLEYSMALLSIL